MPSLIESADAPGSTATSYRLTAGTSLQGGISAGDIDYVQLSVTAGQTYTLSLCGTGTNNLTDTFLRLYAPDGLTLVTSDDDGLPNANSTITFTAATTGTYYAAVSAYNAQASLTGQYELALASGTRPHFDIQMGAGVIDSNASWSTPGAPVTLTYAFRASAAGYSVSGSDISTFTRLSATEMEAVRNALRLWSEVSGVSFVEVSPGGYSDNATLLFGNYTDAGDGAGAFAMYPGSAGANDMAGDVWLNTTSIPTSGTLGYGSYAFNAIMHEIGHALGLSHPGLYNAAPGVSITYGSNSQFVEDSNQYTVMSYFDETNTGANFDGYCNTPMLFDIYSIQNIYGTNRTTRSTSTTYGFNSNAGEPYNFSTNARPAFCIWDAGGIDVIDASGYTLASIISLADESFSSLNGLTNNISIASGVVIENAVGGSGADTLIGNDVSNTLTGNGGNDDLRGNGGNDVLRGGNGINQLVGGGGFDRAGYAGTSASTTITRNPNGTFTLAGAGFSDTLTGVEIATFSDRTLALRERARADIDGDGGSDLVLQSGGTLACWTVQGGVAMAGSILGVVGGSWSFASTGDLDGNGAADLVVQNGGTLAAWTVNAGTVTSGTIIGVATGYSFAATGDFNADGTSDILLQNGTQLAQWRVQDNQAVSGNVIGTLTGGWALAGTGDFNGDGTSDILLQNAGTIAVWTIANGTATAGTVMGYAGGWTLAGTGDFNGDGTTDVLLRNGSALLTWNVRNAVATAASIIGVADAAWSVVGTGDYNGDGTADIALQNGTSVIDWLMGNGTIVGSGVIGNAGSYSVRA